MSDYIFMEEEVGKESTSYEIHSQQAKICKGGLVGRLQCYGMKLWTQQHKVKAGV